MKIAQLSVLATVLLAASGAFAQPAPGGASTSTTTTTTDASTVTNAGSALASDPTTSNIPDMTGMDATPKGEMANTGGEPELMFLAGLALATGGLLLRRKTGSQRI